MSVYSSWRVNGLFLTCSAWSLFLKTVSTLKEHSSLWLHHYCRILKTAQLWRKINSNGDYWVRLFQVGKAVGNWVCLCVWWNSLEWWGEISHPAACAVSPRLCWAAAFECSVSVLTLLRHERALSCRNVTALLLHPYKGFSTEVEYLSIHLCWFSLLHNSTLLNWDFTLLLITWEVFLLLELLGAVLGSQLCCSQTNGASVSGCLPPPVISWEAARWENTDQSRAPQVLLCVPWW